MNNLWMQFVQAADQMQEQEAAEMRKRVLKREQEAMRAQQQTGQTSGLLGEWITIPGGIVSIYGPPWNPELVAQAQLVPMAE